MTSKRYAMTEAEAETERWFIGVQNSHGDLTDALDEELDPGTRRVSDWELVTVVDRFSGHIEPLVSSDGSPLPVRPRPIYPRNYWSLLYVWRCRIVDVGGEE